VELEFRETQLTDLEALFQLRAATRENPLSRDPLAKLGITPGSAGHGYDLRSYLSLRIRPGRRAPCVRHRRCLECAIGGRDRTLCLEDPTKGIISNCRPIRAARANRAELTRHRTLTYSAKVGISYVDAIVKCCLPADDRTSGLGDSTDRIEPCYRIASSSRY
jgi:hypothetical protein